MEKKKSTLVFINPHFEFKIVITKQTRSSRLINSAIDAEETRSDMNLIVYGISPGMSTVST